MTYPKIDGYQYHLNQFEEFYKEQFASTAENERPDIRDFAWEIFTESYNSDAECGNPWDFVSYSAGVYCGAIAGEDDWDYPTHYVIHPEHEPRFMNEHTNGADVVENVGNPDKHADDSCDFMQDLINLIQTHNPDAELTPDNLIEPMNALMALAVPQYKIVLGMWNSHMSDEELEAFAKESHHDTMPSYL